MEDRIDKIRACRPALDLEYDAVNASVDLVFQNEVLRPILKFQNPLLLGYFLDYCLKKKVNFTDLSQDKQKHFVSNLLSKEQKIKNQMIGMVAGLMSVEEHKYYLANLKSVNKRIISMLKERILSQL